MRFISVSSFLLFVLLFCPQCSPPVKDPALVAYEGFAFALRSNQEEKIWEGLSANTQVKFKEKILAPLTIDKAVSAHVKELSASEAVKIEGLIRIKLGYAFENSFAQKAKIEQATITLPNLKYILIPQSDQKQLKIPMVYENQLWKVDLSDAKSIDTF